VVVIVGVPKEIVAGEKRVALVPAVLKKLIRPGFEVLVESGAGEASGCPSSAYQEAGAALADSAQALYASADVIAKVQPPAHHPGTGRHELDMLRPGTTLIAHLQAYGNGDVVRGLAERQITSFALELMPRITRAQSMDVLSSMSTLAGYKAVLIAANHLPKLFPMLMTAAGTIKAARVLVLGAGVAGLQAIATARRLGAVVEAFDVRAAAKQQVESVGARFIELPNAADAEASGGYAREQSEAQLAAQRELLGRRMAEADAVICTALVPGRRAPVLMTAEQVKGMRPGSVVVDLAAEQGGNCALTVPGEITLRHGVTICGPLHVASSLPVDASAMFARNLANFLLHLTPGGELTPDWADELVVGTLVTRDGKIVHPAVRAALEA
jgi:H+-translocating NAD(P) transhydrogenase subunit alpha